MFGIRTASALSLAVLLCACPGPRAPEAPPADALTLEIGRDGGSLRGVAGDGTRTYAALTVSSSTTIEARRGNRIAWSRQLAGDGGPLAVAKTKLFAALGGAAVAGIALRGEPGAMLVALDVVTGAEAWKLAVDASEWAVITSLAPTTDHGVIVGGTFGGTLRVGATIVSSAGGADGFVARVDGDGKLRWLIRVGGVHADGVSGVATAGERIAIAGTFATTAELLGTPLVAYDDKTPRTDGFVASLEGNGSRVWSQTFGGKLDDSVAGVAIDAHGRVAVAASVRAVFKIGAAELVALGDGDGCVGWWNQEGVPAGAVQLGGIDLDGVRGIAAVGAQIVVGGVFSGTMKLGDDKHGAAGGDDAYLAAFDNGTFTRAWIVTGEAREEIAAVASVPGGFIAGVTHTAKVSVDGGELAANNGGAGLVVRALP